MKWNVCDQQTLCGCLDVPHFEGREVLPPLCKWGNWSVKRLDGQTGHHDLEPNAGAGLKNRALDTARRFAQVDVVEQAGTASSGVRKAQATWWSQGKESTEPSGSSSIGQKGESSDSDSVVLGIQWAKQKMPWSKSRIWSLYFKSWQLREDLGLSNSWGPE